MKTPFNESYVSSHQDPVDGQLVDFDWQELATLMGETQRELEPRDYEALAEALSVFLRWLVDVPLGHESAAQIIGRKTLALVWTINPALMHNSPSLAEAANQLGLDRQRLSAYAAEVTRRFSVTNRSQQAKWGKRRRRESLAAINK